MTGNSFRPDIVARHHRADQKRRDRAPALSEKVLVGV